MTTVKWLKYKEFSIRIKDWSDSTYHATIFSPENVGLWDGDGFTDYDEAVKRAKIEVDYYEKNPEEMKARYKEILQGS